jgi:glucose/arabinose dehydrogenase
MRRLHFTLIAGAVILLAACGPIAGPTIGPGPTAPVTIPATSAPSHVAPLQDLTLTEVASGFDFPVDAAVAPGDDRLFVVEKEGRIRILDGDRILPDPFLDITDEVTAEEAEQGLVGLAFHPDYAENGRVFVYYTRPDWSTALVEYHVSSTDPDRIDPESARPIFTLAQPHPAHNGAQLAFGPDGYLYVSLGDGGVTFQRNARDPNTWYGTILRLDVDAAFPYAIPPDNPFVDGRHGAPEVWAYGFRNPWRVTIDPVGQVMYVADVGFERWEEIDVIGLDDGGHDYGWPIVEGPECFEAESCDRTGLTEPTLTIEHQRACAVVGGPVYRGSAIPELTGDYFYGDYCVGWIRSFHLTDGAPADVTTWSSRFGEPGQITSFATDANGEILVLLQSGEILRIDPVR